MVLHLIQVLYLEFLVIGEEVEGEGGDFIDVSVGYLHYILLALVQLSTAALQIRTGLLDHPSQLLQIIHFVPIYEILQH